jgi:DNA-binding transcriptional LysR family regulator
MPHNAAVHARQLSYFLAVVDHGGFGRAAAVLGIAQPTLSQSVKGLERELGAELFHRASPGVVLTAAGRALLGPARQLVRDVAGARASVGGDLAAAAVDIVASAPLGVYPGAELIAGFAQTYPHILVRLDRPETDEALATMVRDGTSELGLSYLPVPRLGLIEIPLGRHELLLAFPPRRAPGPGAVPLAALVGVSLLGTPKAFTQRDLVEGALRAAGVRTRVAMEVPQRDTILDLVAAGTGVAFVVDGAREAAAERGLELRSVDPPLHQPFGLIHRDMPLTEPARAFVAHVRGEFDGAGRGRR